MNSPQGAGCCILGPQRSVHKEMRQPCLNIMTHTSSNAPNQLIGQSHVSMSRTYGHALDKFDPQSLQVSVEQSDGPLELSETLASLGSCLHQVHRQSIPRCCCTSASALIPTVITGNACQRANWKALLISGIFCQPIHSLPPPVERQKLHGEYFWETMLRTRQDHWILLYRETERQLNGSKTTTLDDGVKSSAYAHEVGTHPGHIDNKLLTRSLFRGLTYHSMRMRTPKTPPQSRPSSCVASAFITKLFAACELSHMSHVCSKLF